VFFSDENKNEIGKINIVGNAILRERREDARIKKSRLSDCFQFSPRGNAMPKGKLQTFLLVYISKGSMGLGKGNGRTRGGENGKQLGARTLRG
jgi:hypothetical protein